MKKIVFWKPTIIFDPDETTWTRIADIERAFDEFFTAYGMRATAIPTWPNNESTWRLEPIEDPLEKLRKASDQPQKGVQKALDNVRAQATQAGRGGKNGKS